MVWQEPNYERCECIVIWNNAFLLYTVFKILFPSMARLERIFLKILKRRTENIITSLFDGKWKRNWFLLLPLYQNTGRSSGYLPKALMWFSKIKLYKLNT